MTLLELQRRMAQDVTRPLTPDFGMQPEAEDGTAVATIAEHYIKPNERLSSFDRLEIYNRQYWFRVIGSVAEDFPALQAVVGSKSFDALVLAYLRENPSTSFNLRDLGANLPKWLEAHPEFCSRRRQLALDTARLEWAYIEAYDRAVEAPLDASGFVALREESTLFLQPHVQLLALSYPVDELVLAVHRANPAVDTVSNAVSGLRATKRSRLPAMRRSRTYLAVHRFDNTVYYRRLDREAYLLLAALRRGISLGAAMEAAFAKSNVTGEEQAGKIQKTFAHAAELGWFIQPSTHLSGGRPNGSTDPSPPPDPNSAAPSESRS
jgi:hypothetical protein